MQIRWKFTLVALSLITLVVWIGILASPDQNLYIITCDVGQGDAILAQLGRTQVLIDGGPGNLVTNCLGNHMPFWDREIEVVILTHPQKDHYEGLIEVFRRYDVQLFLATALDSSSPDYKALKDQVGGSAVRVVNPTIGTTIRLGLMHLDILHPPHQFFDKNDAGLAHRSQDGVLGTYTTSKDPNDFSIVTILSYKDFDALLTGDIGPKISDLVAEELVLRLASLAQDDGIEYLKVPHHGSKNGLTKELLDVTNPKVAVISSGKNNQYGHPHEETIKLLSERWIKILRTDEMGDVEIVTDGQRYYIKD